MPSRRVFVSGVFQTGDLVELAADDARKFRVVLRCINGDAVTVVDSAGQRFAATLERRGPHVRAILREAIRASVAPRLRIVLAQAMPKGAKMDFVIEKATELGVVRIVPFTSERTEVATMRAGKLERWRRIAKSAATQCGRSDVPEVESPLAFEALIERMQVAECVLVPWELAEAASLRETLPTLVGGVSEVLLAIGPEGGFSENEARGAEAAGGHLISLGPRILRTETAGLVATVALLSASGDL